MMNVHDETEDLFNEYMRNQEDNQDNYEYYEGAIDDDDDESKEDVD